MSGTISLIESGNPCHLDIALRYAQARIYVFPCNGDKEPCTPNGFKDAVNDELNVRRWWKRYPNALVGIACGLSGIIVFDCDQKKGHAGVKEFMAIAREYGIDLSQCPSTGTPSGGGAHCYFALPPGFEHGNGTGDLPPGIDVRGAGYVIAAGCELPDGRRYTHMAGTPDLPTAYLAKALPILPDALRARITARKALDGPQGGARAAVTSADPLPPVPARGPPTERERAYANAALSATHTRLASQAPGTGRNQALNDAALAMGEMVATGWIDGAEVVQALFDAADRNGYLAKDGEKAVSATLRSGMAAGMSRPRAPLAADDLPILPGVVAYFAQVKANFESAKNTAGDMANFVNPATLFGQPVPEREWIVDSWLSVGTVTVNYGDGGTGKSLLAQQLMTSCATGKPWCGLAVTRCRTLALFCEDDKHELHRRQDKINDALGVTFNDLHDMRWMSGIGKDNVLGAAEPNGRVQLTERFDKIKAAAKEHKARLVIIDTAADTFAGNENDRLQVRQFLNLLGGLALEIDGAVLLNAHPSRAGMSSGNHDGGSTAWSNTARSRWSLAHPSSIGGDAQPDANERILTRRKANYASKGETITLRWVAGVLAPLTWEGGVSGSIIRQAVEHVFLALLDRCAAQGVFVSISRNAGNYAPKVFTKRADACGYNKKDFELAISSLIETKQIRIEDYRGPGRNPAQRIVRQDAGII